MDWMPQIEWELLENDPEAKHISMQLMSLQTHEDQFASALCLFDHVEQLMVASKEAGHDIRERAAMAKWLTIAANHAALTIYHFQSTLRSIRDRLQYAQRLAKKVDSKALQDAYDRFHAEFPSWKYVRDWVAHFADKLFKPDDIEEHRPDDGVFIHGTMMDRSLVFTRAGERMSLDMTSDNLRRLRSIKQDAFLAFQKASVWPPPDRNDRQ